MSTERLCPGPGDIEPICFNLDTKVALSHAQGIVDKLELSDGVKPAIGLIIPSKYDPNRILYGLRNPMYSGEFPDAWGLPSTSMSIEMLLNLVNPNGEINIEKTTEAIDILTNKKNKLPGISLYPEKIIGWTGRIRQRRDGYDGDYYLIMVDIRTKPVNPNVVPPYSVAYSEFRWLTPTEHMEVVTNNPSKACGACSALAYEAFLKERQ